MTWLFSDHKTVFGRLIKFMASIHSYIFRKGNLTHTNYDSEQHTSGTYNIAYYTDNKISWADWTMLK